MNRSRLADLVGAGLLVTVAVAVLASAWINDGSPWRTLATLLAAGLAYVAGRRLVPVVHIAAFLLAGVIASAVVTVPRSLFGIAVAPPLWYSNANAALYVQVAGLTAIAATTVTGRAWRTSAMCLTVGLVALTATTGSLAGSITGVTVLVAALLVARARPRRPPRALLAGCLALVLVAQVSVLALGVAYRPGQHDGSAAEAAAASSLSDRRLALWSDAVSIAAEHPFTGVGPGQFATTSPTARANSDTSQAHSATLQMAAETGWPGGVALLCLLLWAACRPMVTDSRVRSPGPAIIAAVSLTALAVHGSIDYVLSFPSVVVAAALVLGAGTGRPVSSWPAAAKRPVRRLAAPPGT